MVLSGGGRYFEIFLKSARYFENLTIFGQLKDILTIIGFMVVRGGGRYFEMYLKIARFFEN